MKPISFIYVLLITLLFACKDKNTEPVEFTPIYESGLMANGSLKALKNGLEFTASSVGLKYEKNYFAFSGGTYQSSFLREHIALNKIPYKIGKYKVIGNDGNLFDGTISSFYGTTGDDGDVMEDSYHLDETQDNWLEVTAFDTIQNFAKGKFDIYYLINEPNKKINPKNPTKVHFSNAIFDIKLLK
jgi:hypothetical protein